MKKQLEEIGRLIDQSEHKTGLNEVNKLIQNCASPFKGSNDEMIDIFLDTNELTIADLELYLAERKIVCVPEHEYDNLEEKK